MKIRKPSITILKHRHALLLAVGNNLSYSLTLSEYLQAQPHLQTLCAETKKSSQTCHDLDSEGEVVYCFLFSVAEFIFMVRFSG